MMWPLVIGCSFYIPNKRGHLGGAERAHSTSIGLYANNAVLVAANAYLRNDTMIANSMSQVRQRHRVSTGGNR